MILDSASKGNGDNSLSTFYLEYRGAILSIVHSNINGVDYLGGTIEGSSSFVFPTFDIKYGIYENGLDDFILTFKSVIDSQHLKRAINSAFDY